MDAVTECEKRIEALMAEIDVLEAADVLQTDRINDLEHCVEQRHDELVAANAVIEDLKSVIEINAIASREAIEDLNVQCKFWRQAAEHAVKGWNDLEDRVEAAREALVAIEHNADTALELLGIEEDAPPYTVSGISFASITKDPSSPGFPRLVETETPIDARKDKP